MRRLLGGPRHTVSIVVNDPVIIEAAPPSADVNVHRLRVIYLDHVARLSGGELALANTLPALLAHVDPLVVLAESGPLEDRLAASGIPTRVLPLGDGVRDLRRGRALSGLRLAPLVALLRYVWRLRGLIKAEQADLVHTNSLKSALYGGVAGRLAGVPVVWHIRDRVAPDYLPGPVVQLVRALARVVPSAVVANSRTTLATLPGLRGEVLTAPGATGLDVTPPPRVSRAAWPLRIGLVGRLSPWKGQDLFLRAFAEAFPDGDTRAVIIGSAMFGEDAYADSLPVLARELGLETRVDFLGFRADVASELARLDVLVHCSTTPEPFGQVVLEGMLAGLPVIAPAEGGPAEVITDGVDGLLIAPRDAHALAHAMKQCAADPELRAQLGTAGSVTAHRYSPEATAAGLLRAYRAVKRSSAYGVTPAASE